MTQRQLLTQIIEERERDGYMSATPDRTLKAGDTLDLEGVERDGRERRQIVGVSVLDRLKSRGRITGRQYGAGDQLRHDMEAAQWRGAFPAVGFEMPARVDPNPYDSISGTATDRMLAARKKCRGAYEALGRHLWPIVDMAVLIEPNETLSLIGAQLFGRANNKASEAAAVESLKIALDALGDYYYGRGDAGGFHYFRAGGIVVHRMGRRGVKRAA